MRDLCFFERRKLQKKGKADAAAGKIETIHSTNQSMYPGKDGNMGFSAFMQDELCEFNHRRDRSFLTKRYLVHVYGNKYPRLRCMTFNAAVELLDKQAADAKKRADELKKEKDSARAHLDAKKTVRLEGKKAPEIERLFQKQECDLENAYKHKEVQCDKRCDLLNNEKKRIFGLMTNYMNKKLSRTFLRISHYYDAARDEKSAGIPVRFLDRNTLIEMYSAYPLGRYSEKTNDKTNDKT